MCPPSFKFSTTVSSEKILLPSRTCAIPFSTIFDGFALVISSPSTDIVPFCYVSILNIKKPVIDLITVVFPEPLLPSKELFYLLEFQKKHLLKQELHLDIQPQGFEQITFT